MFNGAEGGQMISSMGPHDEIRDEIDDGVGIQPRSPCPGPAPMRGRRRPVQVYLSWLHGEASRTGVVRKRP